MGFISVEECRESAALQKAFHRFRIARLKSNFREREAGEPVSPKQLFQVRQSCRVGFAG